ncbi:MAG: NUDIX domain-containing protein [Nitrososphaerota archaeon]|nr:NUDIX domain-containing protein [Nitrososphaerota archaeon]
MGGEVVDLVDDRDRVVGSATIERCLAEGLTHRAVAVLVVRSGGMLVLQQRSRRDLWHPGLWTISSTGHVKKGEGYLAAARRELFEELGIEGRLTLVRKYAMPPVSDRGLTERERVALFTCKTDSPCVIDRAELESVKDVTERELRGMLHGGPLTPDARLILADYLG